MDSTDSTELDEDLLDDAALVVSELITNAIQAGCARAQIDLVIDDHCLRIVVRDDAPGRVMPREALPDDANGRGLGIVGALARG